MEYSWNVLKLLETRAWNGPGSPALELLEALPWRWKECVNYEVQEVSGWSMQPTPSGLEPWNQANQEKESPTFLKTYKANNCLQM